MKRNRKVLDSKNRSIDALLALQKPMIETFQVLVNVEKFKSPHTIENIAHQLKDFHQVVGCSPDYTCSHSIDGGKTYFVHFPLLHTEF